MPEKILHVIYRISDKGNPKSKLANASKLDCLTNAVQEFGAENFHVIADNCADTTLDVLKSADLDFEITANGIIKNDTSVLDAATTLSINDTSWTAATTITDNAQPICQS